MALDFFPSKCSQECLSRMRISKQYVYAATALAVAATVFFGASLNIYWPRCEGGASIFIYRLALWAATHEIPGLQIYIKNGDRVQSCAIGNAAPNGNGRPMAANDILPYASLTKVFTSTLVVDEAERGMIDLSDRIVETLNQSGHSPGWEQITIDSLLMHRAGFDRNKSGDPMFEPKPVCPDNLSSLYDIPLDHQPNSTYVYSNLGYCLLGVLLERATGTPYSQLMEDNIVRPLGLDSVRRIQNVRDVSASVKFRFADEGEKASFDRLDWRSLTAIGAWSGTARDYAKFLAALLDDEDRLHRAGKTLLQPLPDCDESQWRHCHGRAFYSYKTDSARMFWRDGSLPGVTAFAAVLRPDKIFVLLANGRERDWIPVNDELGQLVYGALKQ